MQTFNDLSTLPEKARGAAVVIGNFDGVHRGHRALLDRAKEVTREKGMKTAVLTFEPHPKRLFRPDDPPARITPAPVKAARLEAEGVDILFSLPFDWDFASQSAGDFIRRVLIEGLQAAHVIVGYDFCFGQMRRGTPAHIEAAGIPVSVVEQVTDEDGLPLSSSRIRQFLRHGKIGEANALLGWEWEIRGEVVRGDRRGHELGFPTANVMLSDTVHPAYGVYAARVQVEGERDWRPAAVNIGIRPMFEIKTAQVESYIFDFNREIYDQVLRIRPVKRLRSEAKFASIEALVAQMKEDCNAAREVLIP